MLANMFVCLRRTSFASLVQSSIYISFGLLISGVSTAQAQLAEQSATYVSQVDSDLTIRRVALLPVADNVEGIYARQIESQLNALVKASHRWDFVETNIVGAIPALAELEEASTEVLRVTRTIEADAFIAAAASRGPQGLSIKLDLFLKKDGRLLAQEVLKDHPRFEIQEIRNQVKLLYEKMIAKVPYSGLVLSRQQNRVTINLGKSDGINKDQVLSAIQIISVNRHPKFSFIISTEKEILGRIKILKVDETLSFGAIIAEKEKGAIQRLAKIAGLEPVTYPVPEDLDTDKSPEALESRPDAKVTFGNEPKEWLPVRPPSFGQVGIKVGLGNYASSVNLSSGALEAKSPFYPFLGINAELWMNPNWIVRTELAQAVISTSNPRAGSSPSDLNHSLSKYSLALGYNFLLRDDFFGPKLQLSGGFANYRMYVDDSQPRALTTVNYSGLLIGLSGSFPLTEERLWYLGGQFNMYLLPKLSETPVTSGSSSSNTINDFSLFIERRIAENIRAISSIDFSLYSSNLSGSGTRTDADGNAEPATSLSHKHSQLSVGINYMF